MIDEQEYAEFGKSHFGSVSRCKVARIVEDAGDSILDVGCGPGAYLQALGDLGHQTTGIDANSLFVQSASKYSPRVYQVDLENERLNRFAEGSFDTVLMLDILEHVEDDVDLLRDALRVCRKNVILTVPTRMPPAFAGSQFVFGSYLDPTHLRYYSRAELLRLLESAGIKRFKIEIALRYDPILYRVFPRYLQYPLSIINRMLLKISDPNLFATVWYAQAFKGAGSNHR
jgi:2-polyprenyl-3-methyl-5-hydroxy-6-metoxy-1,4-benzoquinol methylase